ncbi:MAG: glycosyltransferase [Elusimicrobia bacterium]|nr:glycosyltransferase [Elusimicrobiota bacterium]
MHADNCILSVVIITSSRRLEYFNRCLESVIRSVRASGAEEGVEIIIVSSRGERPPAGQTADAAEAFVRYFEAAEKIKPMLRNFGLKEAAGEFVYFIDDDTLVPSGFIAGVIRKIKSYPECAVIGGPNLNPQDSSLLERTQGYVLMSFWGSMGMSKRYSARGEDMKTDQTGLILCNLGFRKSVMEKEKLGFDSRLNYNEENNLMKDLAKKGYKMIFSPEIYLFHYRRPGFWAYLMQVASSGKGRASSIKISMLNMGLIYTLPAILVLYLIALPLLSTVSTLSAVPAVLYLLVTLYSASRNFILHESKAGVFMLSVLLYISGHISYGVGFWAGLAAPLGRKK